MFDYFQQIPRTPAQLANFADQHLIRLSAGHQFEELIKAGRFSIRVLAPKSFLR